MDIFNLKTIRDNLVKIVIIYFYNDLLGPCKIQTPLIETVESEFERKAEFRKINVDKEKELVEKYKVNNAPTIVIECNGKERERFVGLTQELFLRRAIEKSLKER